MILSNKLLRETSNPFGGSYWKPIVVVISNNTHGAWCTALVMFFDLLSGRMPEGRVDFLRDGKHSNV